MKKYFFVTALLLTIVLIPSCSKKEDNNPTEPNEPPISPKTEWTFLLYDDADFESAYDPFNNFSELISSNSQINYLVLRDGNSVGASYFKIGENHEQVLLENLGELNMGESSTLNKFIDYAKKYYPAERYIVAFYDHGGAWMGACIDITSQNDILTPAEMNNAIAGSGGVDLVLFTAPCLMGSLEAAYQLRNSTKYYIGSEDLSGFIFWMGMLDKFDFFVKNDSQITSESLAKEIIYLHDENKNAHGYGTQITMSAVKTVQLNSLVASFDKVAKYYLGKSEKFKSISKKNVYRYYSDFCDFHGLLETFKRNENDSTIVNRLTETIKTYHDCVIAYCNGDSTKDLKGLNIYFPSKRNYTEIYHSPIGAGLDFKYDCSWDELITKSLSKSSSGKPDKFLDEILKLNGYKPD